MMDMRKMCEFILPPALVRWRISGGQQKDGRYDMSFHLQGTLCLS